MHSSQLGNLSSSFFQICNRISKPFCGTYLPTAITLFTEQSLIFSGKNGIGSGITATLLSSFQCLASSSDKVINFDNFLSLETKVLFHSFGIILLYKIEGPLS